MARPKIQQAHELILPVFTQWERVGSVTSILSDLEVGIFYDAALWCDQMMRDDRVKGCWNQRIESVLGLPVHFEPANVSAKSTAQRAADEAAEKWEDMLPDEELSETVRWGTFLGPGIARKNWEDVEGWMPRLQTWHPGALRFDLVTDMYMLRTKDTPELPIVRGDPNWTLFTPYGHKYGRLNGLARAFSMLVLCRQWAFRDRARHSEVHGEPIRQGITPIDADQRDKDAMRRVLAAPGSETVLITPQGAEGQKWDAKLIEAQENSHQTFSAQIDHLDDAIAILMLGQKSSTKGSTGLGSDANPGEAVRRDVLRFTAKCVQKVARDVLGDWALFNYGDRSLAPKMVIEVDPPEDGQKKSIEIMNMAKSLADLEAHGVKVYELLEQMGLPMMTMAELEAKKKELIERQRQMLQGPGDDEQDNEDGAGKDQTKSS